jgi:riboflavin synthase
MFTGIIETTGIVHLIEKNGSNISFWIGSSISNELKVDQSVSHNGVCLTVEEISAGKHKVTAIEETLRKTDLSQWKVGNEINIERCMMMNGRLDGHIVQGHVDATAICISKKVFDGSVEFTFGFDESFAQLLIEKGSVAINGTSLTCFNVGKHAFTVAIIPYTLEHTNFKQLNENVVANIEFDVIGKYVQRMVQVKS